MPNFSTPLSFLTSFDLPCLYAALHCPTTKSVEFMPFYLSLFSFLASSLWLGYELLSHDLFLASPNLVGSPLGILHLLVYCIYRKKGCVEQNRKWDLEKQSDELKQHLEGDAKKPVDCLHEKADQNH